MFLTVVRKTKITIWHNGRIKSIAFFPNTGRTALEEHIRATFQIPKTRALFVLVDNEGDEIPLTSRLPDGLKLSLRTVMTRPEDTPTRIWLHFQKQYKLISEALGGFCSDLNLLVTQYAVPVRNQGAKVDLWCRIAQSWWVGTLLNTKKDKVQIHFDGWETKYHEWLAFDHDRIADLNTHTPHRVPTFTKNWRCPHCLCSGQAAWRVRCACATCPGVRSDPPESEYWTCTECKFPNVHFNEHCDACALKDRVIRRPHDYKSQNQNQNQNAQPAIGVVPPIPNVAQHQDPAPAPNPDPIAPAPLPANAPDHALPIINQALGLAGIADGAAVAVANDGADDVAIDVAIDANINVVVIPVIAPATTLIPATDPVPHVTNVIGENLAPDPLLETQTYIADQTVSNINGEPNATARGKRRKRSVRSAKLRRSTRKKARVQPARSVKKQAVSRG